MNNIQFSTSFRTLSHFRYKGDTEVSKIEALKDRYKIIKAENAFDIDRTTDDDDGVYYCKAGGESAEINVVGK
jgi:hypothetical protein